MIKTGWWRACFLLMIMVAAPSFLHADPRQEEWYTTASGDYSVRESLYGNLYATIYNSKGGKALIYLEQHSPKHCRENGERTILHDPLYANGTLVKFSQHCRGEWNLFFATTEAGSEYLLNQFKRSRSVEIKTLDGQVTIFSAVGFLEHYRKFSMIEEAL